MNRLMFMDLCEKCGKKIASSRKLVLEESGRHPVGPCQGAMTVGGHSGPVKNYLLSPAAPAKKQEYIPGYSKSTKAQYKERFRDWER